MTTLTETKTVIINTTQNWIIDFRPEFQDFFEEVDYNFGKRQGDVFQLAKEIVIGEITKDLITGSSSLTQKNFRPDYKNAKLEILETWKWTGRKWLQIKN